MRVTTTTMSPEVLMFLVSSLRLSGRFGFRRDRRINETSSIVGTNASCRRMDRV